MRQRRLTRPRRIAPQPPKPPSMAQSSGELKRREAPASRIVPAKIVEVGEMIYVAEHDWICEVVGKTPDWVFAMSKRTGEGFAIPPDLRVEVLN